MRKITREASAAFQRGTPWRKDNTYVNVRDDVVRLYLFNNAIAKYHINDTVIEVRTANWETPTTKDRLNGIPGVNISQKKGIWSINGMVWYASGNWTMIPKVF